MALYFPIRVAVAFQKVFDNEENISWIPSRGRAADGRKGKGRIQSLSEAWIVITLFFLFCDRAKSILTICMPVRLLTGAASWKIGPKSPYNTWPAENPHGGFCGRPKNICGGIIQREKGGAHLRLRVTEAKMFTAKIFYCCYFNRTEDTKLHTWVDFHRLLLQTTGKANNNYKGIIMLSEVSCCSISSGHTVFGGFLRLPGYFRFIPGQGAHTVPVCPPHCSQKMAICGWQYNASAVPSGPTTQNGNHNPNTCLLGGKKGPS